MRPGSSKSEPTDAKSKPKGEQSEPKGRQSGAKGLPKCNKKLTFGKDCKSYGKMSSASRTFGGILETKVDQASMKKVDAEIDATKVMKNDEQMMPKVISNGSKFDVKIDRL